MSEFEDDMKEKKKKKTTSSTSCNKEIRRKKKASLILCDVPQGAADSRGARGFDEAYCLRYWRYKQDSILYTSGDVRRTLAEPQIDHHTGVECSCLEKELSVKQTVSRLGLELNLRQLHRNGFSTVRNTNRSLIDVKSVLTAILQPPLDVK